MRLEKANNESIIYACKNFHYSKSVPVNPFGFSVYNNSNEWCGVVVFSLGANPKLGMPYGLVNGEFCELTRMALNGKQELTSKVLAVSLILLPKYCPLIKLVISFADTSQNHTGIIYQATNWVFTGLIKGTPMWYVNRKWIHQRQLCSLGFSTTTCGFQKKPAISKFRYLYPIDKTLIPLCKSLSKTYPKKCDNSVPAAQ